MRSPLRRCDGTWSRRQECLRPTVSDVISSVIDGPHPGANGRNGAQERGGHKCKNLKEFANRREWVQAASKCCRRRESLAHEHTERVLSLKPFA
jgi:hypothetical protein